MFFFVLKTPDNANFAQNDTDIIESADKPHSLAQINELEDSISGTQCRAPYIFVSSFISIFIIYKINLKIRDFRV